jgi:hypothetical protein
MAKSSTPWLTYLLIAGGAYGGYVLYQKYKANTATAPPGALPNTTAAVPNLPAPGGQIVDGQVMSPVPSQQLPVSTLAPTTPNGIDPTVYSIVQSWAMTDNRAPVLRMAAAAVPSEYAGMYDLITNYWDKNIPPGPAQVAFWNTLRSSYDPGDAIW